MQTIRNQVSLKDYNTFGIPAKTATFASITSEEELIDVLKDLGSKPFRVLGGGSNILLTQDYNGLYIHMNTKGIAIVEENIQTAVVEIQAGENWHAFVLWALEKDLSGIENLVLIPGSVGAAPIQNIGAYGVELKSVFKSCRVLDLYTLKIKTLTHSECRFGYRSSIFKSEAKGKYIILSVQLLLHKPPHRCHIKYGDLASKLEGKQITPQLVAEAVMSIRQSKLPDPKVLGNSGSFFKNPIVPLSVIDQLKSRYPDLPSYPIPGGQAKISAAWLIDSLGLKGFRHGDAGVHQKQALVLVNYGKATGSEILQLAEMIQAKVKKAFGIQLETEVHIL